MIEDFHFLRPWWLLALAVPAMLAWLAIHSMDVKEQWKGLIAPHLLESLVVNASSGSRLRPAHMLALTIALAVIAAAGPSWQREKPPFVEDTAPLVIAVDLSPTMDAIDLTPSRIERAKLKIRDIVTLRAGARTALIAYAGSAHLVLPLTEDASLIESYSDALATGIMPVKGKDTAKALDLAQTMLAQEPAAGTILLITDGVEQKAFEQFRRGTGNGLVVLAFGTAQGGPVKMPDGGFLAGPDGGRVFAKLDLEGLKNLHALTGTDVATVTDDDTDVRWVAERIRTNFAQKQPENGARWRDAGWWIIIPLALLLVLSFRKGWVVRTGALLLAAHLAVGSGQAEAADFMDAWLTPDQQGRLAFEQGDYDNAAALFRDPMWRGTALYRSGKFAEAIDAFAAVSSAESWYDQGNTLLHLGRYEEAVAAYGKALNLRKDWPDALADLAIAESLLKAEKAEQEDEPQDPTFAPDKIQFDDKGKQGKAGQMNIAEQTSEMWMRNIQVSPAALMARKFAIEAGERLP